MKAPCRRGRRSGATALEFALVGSLLLGLTIFVLQLGYLLYAQTALDYATQSAARAVQTGNTGDHVTAQAFQTNVFCMALGGLLPCSDIALSLRPVSNYLNATDLGPPITNGQLDPGALQFDPGQASSLMLLQAVYVLHGLSWPLAVQPLVAAAAFRNEN